MPLIRGKQLEVDAITSREIEALAVDTAELAATAVTTGKITDLNVTRGKIALLAVDTPQLEANAVTDAKVDSTIIIASGLNAFSGDQSMGTNKLTNLTDGSSSADAVNKGQLDAAVAGLQWQTPAAAKSYIGNRTVVEINSLGTPAAGTVVVATGATATPTEGSSDELDEGDVAEFDGTQWKIVVAHASNFPPDGTRLLVEEETVTLFSPLTDNTDETKYAEFGGSSLTPTLTSPADGDGILVIAGGSVNENKAYVFDSTPAAVWIQFSGLGLVAAGAGLTKTGNTLDVGAGTGIAVAADSISFDATAADGDGLTGSGAVLAVDSDTETGSNIQGVNVTSNGVGLDVAAIAGTNLEADGSANLRIAASAAGGGLTGGGASVLAVGAGNSITVNANDVAVNPAGLIDGGAAEIDGDLLQVGQVPSNYTRSQSGDATADDQLAAHLQGIDDELGTLGGAGTPAQESVTTQVISGSDTAITDTLNSAPISNVSVSLYLNGVHQEQGATKDYTISGQTITWLASSGTAVDMDTSDVLLAVYES